VSTQEPDPQPGRIFQHLDRQLGSRALTARRAAGLISIVTIVLTIAAGLLIRVANPDGIESIGAGLWWAIQTLTTVGYGDVVPDNTAGKVIGTIVMLNGIAFLTVITAAVTATLIDQVHQRRAARAAGSGEAPDQDVVLARLAEISARLDRIEGAMERPDRNKPG
jgi:voltage-gated potassium channel